MGGGPATFYNHTPGACNSSYFLSGSPGTRPNASPRPPLSNLRCMPSLEPCLISCIDVDGLGRRIEAAFSCIAAAHSLKPQGVRYVHIRLFELQHGNAGEIVEEWFGLSRVFPAISVQRSTQRSKSGTLRIGNVLHNLGEAAIGSQHRLVLRNAVEGEHLITSHTGRTLCSGMQQGPATSKFPASPALLANRSWLHGVETGLTRCARDHRTVHTHADCTFFFWCTVATARAGADWYAVLPYDEVPVCMHVLTTAPSPLPTGTPYSRSSNARTPRPERTRRFGAPLRPRALLGASKPRQVG